MAIFGLQPHKIVEVGKLHGLLSGHMIAQASMTIGAGNTLDNGFILNLNQATGALEKAADGTAPVFLHYTEELLNGPVSGLEYFTVEAEADGLCYPRAIALYVGDEFVTNNIDVTVALTTALQPAVVVDGVLTVAAAPAAGEALFLVKKDTLPNGAAAAYVMYVGYAARS